MGELKKKNDESRKIRQETDEKFEELEEANVFKQQTIESLTKKLNCVESEQVVLMNAALDDTKSELQMMEHDKVENEKEELAEYKVEIANYKTKMNELETKHIKL